MVKRHATRPFASLEDALLDAMTQAVVTLDTQGMIRHFNPAAEVLFGYGATEVLGQGITPLIPNVQGQSCQAQGIHKGGTALSLEITAISVEGPSPLLCLLIEESAALANKHLNSTAANTWVDREALIELATSAGPELLLDLTESFLAETEDRCRTIQETTDRDEVGYQSHTMKSSCGTFGTLALAQRALDLDTAYKGKDWQSLDQLRRDILDLFTQTAPVLRRMAQEVTKSFS